MDSLITEIGQPPYQFQTLLKVYQKGPALLDRMNSRGVIDIIDVTNTIDQLEALTSLLFHAVEMDLIEFTMDTTSPATLDRHLTKVIWEVKQTLFRLQTPAFSLWNDSNVCKSCDWALQRIGDGLVTNNFLSFDCGDGIPAFIANCYLCALDTWPDFPRLQAQTNKGCDLCEFILELLMNRKSMFGLDQSASDPMEVGVWVEFSFDPDMQDVHPSPIREEPLRNQLTHGSVYLSTSSMLHPRKVWQFMVESKDRDVAHELQVYPPPNIEVWGPVNVDFVRSQLAQESNELKDTPLPISFAPTRVLDLGVSHDKLVRLAITKDLNLMVKESIKYAALSYCWGPPEDAKKQSILTTTNITTLIQSISDKQLSPVMRDAVLVCRSLGIRYLWIDALCIVQDNESDWEQESQQMSRIYENSYLTICAMASSSCLEGFLPARLVRKEFRYTSPTKAKTSKSGNFTFRPVPGHNLAEVRACHATNTPLNQDMAASRWNERGWVFQEKCMSPRKLFFGQSMIHVQLGRTIISENGYIEILTLQPHSWYVSMPVLNNITPIGELLSGGQHLHDLWHCVVINFTLLKWTKMQDIFPGLSGLATKFNDTLCDRYLAGHWEKDLGCSLVWRMTASRIVGFKIQKSLEELVCDLQRGNVLHAPSWSWASRPRFYGFLISALNGQPCRVRTHLRQEFTLLRSNVTVDGINPYGALRDTSNSMVVSGRIIDFSEIILSTVWSVADNVAWDCWNVEKGYLIQVWHDWEPDRGRNAFGGSDEDRALKVTERDGICKLKLLLLSSCCSAHVESDFPQESLRYGTEAMKKVALGHGYRETFLHDTNYRYQGGTCGYCQKRHSRRDVWGLLVYPAGAINLGRYLRVGVFSSRAALGGSLLFEGAKVAELELV